MNWIWEKICSLTKRDLTEEEQKQLNEVFSSISDRCRYLLKNPGEAVSTFKADIRNEKQMDRIRHDLDQMTFVCCASFTVATRFHPISWFGYGFCVPYLPGSPIMISEKTFKEGKSALQEIVVHEFSHSQLKTVDGALGNGENAEEFEDLISDAWVWTFLLAWI